MNPYNFAVLFFAICTFFISILVWLKRPDEIEKRYFLFSVFVAIWGVGFAIEIGGATTYAVALKAVRFGSMAAVFIPVTWLHFAVVFNGSIQRYRITLLLFYFVAMAIDIFAFTPWFISALKPAVGFRYYAQFGFFYHLFTVTFFILVPLGFFELFRKMQKVEGAEKFRIKGLIFATLNGFVGGALTFLPSYAIHFPQYGLFLMPIYPFMMAYFIMREQLFDVEELVTAVHREKLVAIGMLAASINHEIRNPLYIIQGSTQSFLANFEEGIFRNDESALKRSVEVLRKTMDQSLRAMDIMKRFAMFSKQDVKQEPQIEKVDLRQALNDISLLVMHELELHKIDIIQDIPEGFSPLQVDRRHFEEILFNLIVNACQAMKGENISGKIEISAEQQNSTARISIKDNGPGIPSDKLNQIFEPFYSTKAEGTGLGLYITKQLVERNHGKISVVSKPGRGTEFSLCFFIATNEIVASARGKKTPLYADKTLSSAT